MGRSRQPEGVISYGPCTHIDHQERSTWHSMDAVIPTTLQEKALGKISRRYSY